jgi:hypothetical protein
MVTFHFYLIDSLYRLLHVLEAAVIFSQLLHLRMNKSGLHRIEKSGSAM